MTAGHGFWGVSRDMVRDYLGRLVQLAHPSDYDTVRAIEKDLECFWSDRDAQPDLFEKRDRDLRDLCFEAGLITEDDETTDVVPLLRMFLPVE